MYTYGMSIEHPSLSSPDYNNLPALLYQPANELGRAAAMLLDAHRIPFTAAAVDEGLAEPILRIGEDELRGIDEIKNKIGAIASLTS